MKYICLLTIILCIVANKDVIAKKSETHGFATSQTKDQERVLVEKIHKIEEVTRLKKDLGKSKKTVFVMIT